MTPYIPELLTEINATPSLLATKFKDTVAVTQLLQYAFDTSLKFILPEGMPPYKKDASPLGMSPANFYGQIRKLYIFTRADLTPIRREQLFVQLLEGLHPTEADICVLVKDQTLTSVYPNITADLVVKAGLVKEENIFRPVATSTSKGKSLVVNLSDGVATKESFGTPPVPVAADAPVAKADAKADAKVKAPRKTKVKAA